MVWDEHSVPITQKDSVLVNLNETPLPLHELIIVGVHNTAEEQGINSKKIEMASQAALATTSSSPMISEDEGSALDCDLTLSPSTAIRAFAASVGREEMNQQHSNENSTAAYFLWPASYRSHGRAEDRTAYFHGLQKESEDVGMSEKVPCGQQATTLLDVMTIRAYHSKRLRRASLGTAVGFRTRRGALTCIPAIIVLVARKVHTAWLHDGQRLPVYLEGPGGIWCDVDVVEFAYYGAPVIAPKEQVYTELVEGLRGGDPCIGPGSQVASQETYGTLGAIVQSRVGAHQVGFLTNRHVAVDLDYPNQKMFHPLPPNVGPGVYLGAVERATSFITDERWYSIFASLNPETFVRADGAFIPFAESFDLSRVTTTIKGVGDMGDVYMIDLQAPISSVVGKQVVKVGRSSGLTKGSIMAYALEYNDEKGICFFTDFLIVGENKQAFDLEGDSGSLVLLVEEKPRPIGIIWGGTANRGRLKLRSGHGPENWTSGVDLGRLLQCLQLELITSDSALNDAIQHQKRISSSDMVVGECCSKYFAMSEANRPSSFMNSFLQVESHISQVAHGDVVSFENKSEMDINDGATLVCSGDKEPIDFMKELDFGMQRREYGQHAGLPALHKVCYEDISSSLHLSNSRPSWL